MAKRRGRERGQDGWDAFDGALPPEMSATLFPIACSGADCEERSHLLLPGDSPYEGGVFTNKGWTAVVADRPPAITFLCAGCFEKEVAKNQVTTRPRTPVMP